MSRSFWLQLLLVLVLSGSAVFGLLSLAELRETPIDLFGRELTLSEPRVVLLVAVLPILLLGTFRSLTGLALPQRLLSLLLRVAFLVVLILGVGQPVETRETAQVCAVALVDVSDSVGDAAIERALSEVEKLQVELVADQKPRAGNRHGDENQLRVLVFGESASEVEVRPPSGAGPFIWPSPTQLRKRVGSSATELSGALRSAAAWTPSGCVPRYVVFSDGIETRGDALSEMARARGRGVRISTRSLTDRPPTDVAVVDVQIPDGVRVGESFDVRVELRATRSAKGRLRLMQGELDNGLGGVRTLELKAGHHVETFPSVVRVKGEVVYRAIYEPEVADDAGDHFPHNNEFSVALDVPGPPRVLLIDRRQDQASYLARALVAQQFDVDVRSPDAFPGSAAELSAYSFLILSDVPRSDFSRGAESLTIDYVKRGGGLLYAGGEAAYGPGGWQGSDLGRVLPVRMDAEKDKEIPGVALALVIDRSGSMTGMPLEMAKEACRATLSVLDANDLLEVVAFDSRPSRLVRMQPARYRSRIISALMRLTSSGGTEIFNSLDMAYQDLAAIEARKKHIVLLTDGDAGSDGIYELSTAALAEGITITTVGLGAGANRQLLQMIAEAGGGRYHHADDPSSLPRIFTRETQLISKEATVEDWFPVSVVRRPEFLSGIPLGAAPYLRGFTRTQLGSSPAEAILVSDTGHPILARQRVGMGWTLAWTSDLKARWATDWLRWGAFGRFVAQMVRGHQFVDDTEIRPMEVQLVGDEVIARVDAFDTEERFDLGLKSRLSIKGPGLSEPLFAEFQQVAPGRYEARAKLPAFGSYSLRAIHKQAVGSQQTEEGLRPAGISLATASLPYPEEYRDLSPRVDVLRRWALAGGGAFDAGAAEALSAGDDRVKGRRGQHAPLLLLALGLLILDLFVRRIRIFDRHFHASMSSRA